jgi:hypothetical protein
MAVPPPLCEQAKVGASRAPRCTYCCSSEVKPKGPPKTLLVKQKRALLEQGAARMARRRSCHLESELNLSPSPQHTKKGGKSLQSIQVEERGVSTRLSQKWRKVVLRWCLPPSRNRGLEECCHSRPLHPRKKGGKEKKKEEGRTQEMKRRG